MSVGPYRQSIEANIDLSAVSAFLESKTEAIRLALAERMTAVDLMLQSKIVEGKLSGDPIKRRTGKLSNSVRPIETMVSGPEITGGVTAGGGPAYYAKFLEYGTRAHLIFPVKARCLAFIIDGKQVFAMRVNHPGNRAYAFMRGTLEENSQNIIGEFQDAAAEAANS
jgi:hypothetical protein